jgi:GAF domain-containing protein/multidrug resistance efflux pump
VNLPDVAGASRLSLLSRERLETLLHLSQAFNSTLDVGPLLHRILDQTLAVTESEAGALWVVDGDEVRCTHAAGPAAAALLDVRRPASEGVVGEALRTRVSVVSTNALDDERYARYRADTGAGAESFRTRSAVSIPLVAVDRALAVMELVNDVGDKDEFDEADVAFLELVADDAAAALRNAQLLEEARRADNLRALLEVSHEITATFDLDRVLFSIVNLAGRALRFDRCAIAVRDGERLVVRAISGEAELDAKSPAVRALGQVLAWAGDRGEELVVQDTAAEGDPEAATLRRQFGDYLSSSRARSILVLPIEDAEGELGQLLFEFHAPDALDAWTREASGLLANEAALAIRNAQLYAGVPFIAWLEPLAQRRRALMALPRATLLRYATVAAVAFVLLFVVRLPLRVSATDAAVHAGVQRPARAGVAGTLADVLVREGDMVAAGQVLAVLRNDGLQLRLADADGELRLSERAVLAAEAVGDAASAASARVYAAQLRAAVVLLRSEAEQVQLRAPAPGMVLTPRLEEQRGSYVAPGEAVLWVGAADSAEIRLRVAQQDIGVVRAGDRVRARVAARPETRLEGVVSAVAPRAELLNGQPYYTVRATFDNADGLLRPGMTARARVLTAPRPIIHHIIRRPWRFIRMHVWW